MKFTTKFDVTTYLPSGLRGEPQTVEVEGGDVGIRIALPRGPEEGTDIFIERRPGEWVICIAPNGSENEQIVHIDDAGKMTVTEG